MKRFALLALILAATPVAADTAHQHSPYAGQEARDIKALSLEEIADLAAGRGMGLALAAELNGYPGPRHVLDLAPELGLEDATSHEGHLEAVHSGCRIDQHVHALVRPHLPHAQDPQGAAGGAVPVQDGVRVADFDARAMIFDHPVRMENVGADLAAPRDFFFCFVEGFHLFFLLFQLQLVETGAKDFHRHGPIFVLGALVLTANDYSGGKMCNPNSRVSFVYMLTTLTA